MMKKELLPSIILTVLCIVLFSGVYPGVIWAIAQLSPNKGNGTMVASAKSRQYANIAQSFTRDEYFWPRPSAVNYNAAGSGGSNKGPDNKEYLAIVEQRIDTFLSHNPGITRVQIPSDMVTASGSGLDPDISYDAAIIQVRRIARHRNLPENAVRSLIDKHYQQPLLGIGGPRKVNVLALNIALDNRIK
jgi:K+-transporting ATPase ATPase C chain